MDEFDDTQKQSHRANQPRQMNQAAHRNCLHPARPQPLRHASASARGGLPWCPAAACPLPCGWAWGQARRTLRQGLALLRRQCTYGAGPVRQHSFASEAIILRSKLTELFTKLLPVLHVSLQRDVRISAGHSLSFSSSGIVRDCIQAALLHCAWMVTGTLQNGDWNGLCDVLSRAAAGLVARCDWCKQRSNNGSSSSSGAD